MIEIKNLEKEFKQGDGVSQRVLKSININIDKGEFLTIMGSSGGGQEAILYVKSSSNVWMNDIKDSYVVSMDILVQSF